MFDIYSIKCVEDVPLTTYKQSINITQKIGKFKAKNLLYCCATTFSIATPKITTFGIITTNKSWHSAYWHSAWWHSIQVVVLLSVVCAKYWWCWVSEISTLCLVSLCWVSLCWMWWHHCCCFEVLKSDAYLSFTVLMMFWKVKWVIEQPEPNLILI
jgi:hypothetical protein